MCVLQVPNVQLLSATLMDRARLPVLAGLSSRVCFYWLANEDEITFIVHFESFPGLNELFYHFGMIAYTRDKKIKINEI